MTNNNAIGISGIGALSALGDNFAAISAAMIAGKSGIRQVSDFDVSNHPCQIAGQAAVPECPPELDRATYDSLLPLEQASLWCCVQALKDAGLWAERSNLRVGIVFGLGAEMMLTWVHDLRRGGTLMTDATSHHPPTVETLSKVLGLRGPRFSVAAACASGNHALAHGVDWLRMGWVDVCLAGAVDLGVTPHSLASFGNLRALSRRNDAPTAALRPFDRDRDGMVLGEGGAVFVLEPVSRARARGRDPLVEVAAVGLTSDAHHLVIPNSDAAQASIAMSQALAEAKINPSDVDYVNAHATGTPVGDICEARILHNVLGNHCSQVPVSSTKSMTGHLLSAAAAVEALACLTAITQGVIPPTINLDNPDPECELNHVANQAREHRVRVAVSNSFGFGGHNTSLILSAIDRKVA
jgi:3-oxoacyl-[acyl-carrier-protein] synthase II